MTPEEAALHLYNNVGPFPHCDGAVLHAPGECKYCDDRKDWQALRIVWNIPFTGHGNDPASARRSVEMINRWHGNRARPEVENLNWPVEYENNQF